MMGLGKGDSYKIWPFLVSMPGVWCIFSFRAKFARLCCVSHGICRVLYDSLKVRSKTTLRLGPKLSSH